MNVNEGSADDGRARVGRARRRHQALRLDGRRRPTSTSRCSPASSSSLLGPSGCGKTTTLRMLAGFEQPDEGYIRISGEYVAGRPAVQARREHRVPALRAVPAHDRGRERRLRPAPEGRRQERRSTRRVGEALEMVKMTKLAKRKPRQMSGGQQQRVALARALVNRPSRAAARRAARRPRPQAPPGDADRAEAAPDPGRHHVHLRHPRPGGGAVDVGPHRGHARRPRRAAGRPRHDLRRTRVGLRRRLHRPATTSCRGVANGDGTARTPTTVHRRRCIAGPATSSSASRPSPPSGPSPSRSSATTPARRSTSSPARSAGISHLGDVHPVRRARPSRRRDPRPPAPPPGARAGPRATTVWCTWTPERRPPLLGRQADLVLTDPRRRAAASTQRRHRHDRSHRS